jgi:hypothetical protein
MGTQPIRAIIIILMIANDDGHLALEALLGLALVL